MKKARSLSMGYFFVAALTLFVFHKYILTDARAGANSQNYSFQSYSEAIDYFLADSPDYVKLWIKVQIAELGLESIPKLKKMKSGTYLVGDKNPLKVKIVNRKLGQFQVNGVPLSIDHSDRFVDVFQRVQKVIEVRSPGPVVIGSGPRSKEFLLRLPKAVEDRVDKILVASGFIYHQL